jgi:hypothetical protein
MPEDRGFGVVSAGDGWHLAVIHEDEPEKVHIYAIAAWFATKNDDGDPELVPFIANNHMGSVPLGLFSRDGELAAAVIPPDGAFDEEALRQRAAQAMQRV